MSLSDMLYTLQNMMKDPDARISVIRMIMEEPFTVQCMPL